MKRPVVCVASEVPRLAEILKGRCSHLLAKVTSVDPKAVKPSDAALIEEAEVIISEPHNAQLWLNKGPNLKLVHGTWAGIDR